MSAKTAKLPKWFKGMCYDEGSTVKIRSAEKNMN